MSSAYGYSPRGRERESSHHVTGTISAAIGYVSARPSIALPSNCGRSGLATASASRPINKAFTARSSQSATRRTDEGYAGPADVEGVSHRCARCGSGTCVCRTCRRHGCKAGSVAATAGDREALAPARAASPHSGAHGRLHATRVLRADRLAAPRDEARREPGRVRAVLHLDPAARRRQDDLSPGPAVADSRARAELPRRRRDQLQRLGLVGRGEREHVVRGRSRGAQADGRAGLRPGGRRHVGSERILVGRAYRHGCGAPEPP